MSDKVENAAEGLPEIERTESAEQGPLIASEELRPFYFNVVVWGAEFRELFLELCLASLLAPGNLPAFKRIKGCRFLIATTDTDWAELKKHPNFEAASEFVEIELLEIIPATDEKTKMLAMSSGHKMAARRTFEDKAYGVFISPDTLLSDNFGECLIRHAQAKRRVVLISSIRYETEGILAELKARNISGANGPVVLTGREMVAISNHRMHSESLASSFEIPFFRLFPTHLWWGVGPKRKDRLSPYEPGSLGIILYTFSWSPILVDYASLESHDDEIFDEWTLDGDYVHRNFGNDDTIHVITDSDEAMLISLTPKNQYPVVVKPSRWFFSPRKLLHISRYEKLLRISHVYYHDVMDELKRRIFLEPVYYHTSDLTPEWDQVRAHSKVVLQEALETDATGYLPQLPNPWSFQFGWRVTLPRYPFYVYYTIVHGVTNPWLTFTYFLKFPAFFVPRKLRAKFRHYIIKDEQ